MGTILFDFLKNSVLLDPDAIEENFAGVTESNLRSELESYRQFCLDNIRQLEIEAHVSPDNLGVFSGVSNVSLNQLTQSALYIDRYIVPDPIFPFTRKTSHPSMVLTSYLGMSNQESVDRLHLAKKARYLNSLTPMVAADYVKFLPSTLLQEGPEQVPITYSPTGFSDALPPEILAFFRRYVKVFPMTKTEHGWAVINRELKPCRAISVELPVSVFRGTSVWYLFEQQITDTIDAGDKVYFKARQYLPESPPEKAKFDAWVSQSINQAAAAYFKRLAREVEIAATCASAYLCTAQFDSDLLAMTLGPESDAEIATTNALMSVELPFVENIDPAILMSVRENDGEAFANFRRSLRTYFRDLKFEPDPHVVQNKVIDITNEIIDVHLPEINKKIASLRVKAFTEMAIAVVGLVGTIQTSGWSLLAAVIAATQGLRTYSDYKANVREHPAYFLWKVMRNKST